MGEGSKEGAAQQAAGQNPDFYKVLEDYYRGLLKIAEVTRQKLGDGEARMPIGSFYPLNEAVMFARMANNAFEGHTGGPVFMGESVKCIDTYLAAFPCIDAELGERVREAGAAAKQIPLRTYFDANMMPDQYLESAKPVLDAIREIIEQK